MNETLDLIGALFLVAGALLGAIGAFAMVRFPEIYSRVHTATKPQTLGLFLILIGLGLTLRTWGAVAALVIVMIAQATTAPIAAHMLTRTAYRTGVARPEQLYRDEFGPRLKDDAQAAERAAQSPPEPGARPPANSDEAE